MCGSGLFSCCGVRCEVLIARGHRHRPPILDTIIVAILTPEDAGADPVVGMVSNLSILVNFRLKRNQQRGTLKKCKVDSPICGGIKIVTLWRKCVELALV